MTVLPSVLSIRCFSADDGTAFGAANSCFGADNGAALCAVNSCFGADNGVVVAALMDLRLFECVFYLQYYIALYIYVYERDVNSVVLHNTF